jgi:hypothetical protein
MAERVIFLDLDGPMIPGRAYQMASQTRPIVKTFDPCAVGMLNELCKFRDYKIVLHSSWIKIFGGEDTYKHCIEQGIKAEFFHKDAWCDERIGWRYTRVAKWLREHPGVEEYFVVDDEPYKADMDEANPHPVDLADHLILVDFNDGLLMKHTAKMYGDNHVLRQLN